MSNLPAQIGNYRLIKRLGKGGAGEVWQAHHVYLHNRVVALKVLLSRDKEIIERFKHEAVIASTLSHDNIVEVYDYGVYQATQPAASYHCTVFEHVPGTSLQAMLDTHHRLPLDVALAIVRDVAAALNYAHQQGVIHRDVKPGNILVVTKPLQALLTDFGIASSQHTKMTVDGTMLGTPGYMAPEQLLSATAVTPRSDLYSLGVVLYEMLTGSLPYPDTVAGGYPTPPPDAPPPPLKQHGVVGAPPDLDRVLATLLAFKPEHRYPDGKAVVAALDGTLTRHSRDTQHIAPDGTAIDAAATGTDAVEHALGARMQRDELVRAEQLAASLQQPDVASDLLDAWARQHPFRYRTLGRLARFDPAQTHTYNLYSYHLRVLYERRTPPRTTERPDHARQITSSETHVPLWQVNLPPVKAFERSDGQDVYLPGTSRVERCTDCNGRGRVPCPTCHGKQRIREKREVPIPVSTEQPVKGNSHQSPGKGGVQTRMEEVLVPCTACRGKGALPCERCAEVGRLLLRESFDWERIPFEFPADDLAQLDQRASEPWLHKHCAFVPVYARTVGDGQPTAQRHPFPPEWRRVPLLNDLLDEVCAKLDEQTQVVQADLTVAMLPVTELVFDIGTTDRKGNPRLYTLPVYGFETAIPPDRALFDWRLLALLLLVAGLVVAVAVLAFMLFA